MSHITGCLTATSTAGPRPLTVRVPVPRSDLTEHAHRRYNGVAPRPPPRLGPRRLPRSPEARFPPRPTAAWCGSTAASGAMRSRS